MFYRLKYWLKLFLETYILLISVVSLKQGLWYCSDDLSFAFWTNYSFWMANSSKAGPIQTFLEYFNQWQTFSPCCKGHFKPSLFRLHSYISIHRRIPIKPWDKELIHILSILLMERLKLLDYCNNSIAAQNKTLPWTQLLWALSDEHWVTIISYFAK